MTGIMLLNPFWSCAQTMHMCKGNKALPYLHIIVSLHTDYFS